MVSFWQIVRSLGAILVVSLVCVLVLQLCTFLFRGIITTWRDADYISSLPEEKQESAFLNISSWQEQQQGNYSVGSLCALPIGSRYGAGLVKGASTATIMREIFLGSGLKYVSCAYLMACMLLGWLIGSVYKVLK